MMSTSPIHPASRRHLKIALTFAVGSIFAAYPVFAADNTWTGAVSSDYNDPGNWTLGRVPTIVSSDSLDVRSTPANVATLSADALAQVQDIRVGENNAPGTVGTLRHTAGILASGSGNWTAIGAGNDGAGSFATGIYNLTANAASAGTLSGFGQGSGTLNANSRIHVGGTDDGAYGTGGNGTLNINTTGAVNVTNELLVGVRAATGTVNLDSGTLGVSGQVSLGGGTGSTGNLRMAGGTFNAAGQVILGNGAGGTGNLSIAGGTMASGEITVGGNAGTGFMDVTGGTVNNSGQLFVGNNDNSKGTLNVSAGTLNVGSWLGVGRDGATGTLNISGTGVVNQGAADAGSRLELTNFSKPTTGTVNLNGGTLSTNGIINGAGGTTNFNFNGGVLKPRADNGGFLNGLTAATVQAGGAKIDTDTFTINIGQQLLGSAGDGGLTKSGTGTLELSASNTYNGPTTINAGTLKLNNGSSPGTLAGDGAIFINNGGTVSSGAVDGTGYFNHTANNAINIAEGGTLRTLEGGRLSMDRTINSVGGTIASTGAAFDNDASYAFRGAAGPAGDVRTNSYNFTSSAGGTASTISATNVGVDNVTFNVTQGGGPVDLNVTGNLKDTFGTGGITKTGNGVMVLSNTNNSYTGATTLAAGILELAGAGALTSSSAVNVNGGTFLITGSAGNRVNDSAAVALNTGSAVIPALEFDAAAGTGITETMGPLSVLGIAGSKSVIDLGNALDAGNAGVRLTFAGSGTWTGSLDVWNWTGTLGVDGGVDQLDGFDSAVLTPAQLATIQFYSGDNGTSPVGLGAAIVNGELVPAAVPEPSTLMACLLALIPFTRRKRRA